jgi:hypothetical protein
MRYTCLYAVVDAKINYSDVLKFIYDISYHVVLLR